MLCVYAFLWFTNTYGKFTIQTHSHNRNTLCHTKYEHIKCVRYKLLVFVVVLYWRSAHGSARDFFSSDFFCFASVCIQNTIFSWNKWIAYRFFVRIFLSVQSTWFNLFFPCQCYCCRYECRYDLYIICIHWMKNKIKKKWNTKIRWNPWNTSHRRQSPHHIDACTRWNRQNVQPFVAWLQRSKNEFYMFYLMHVVVDFFSLSLVRWLCVNMKIVSLLTKMLNWLWKRRFGTNTHQMNI